MERLMAERAGDPLFAFRFEVKLGGESVGGFSECSGIQLETEVHDYPEGGLNTHTRKFPTRTKQSNLTLKRGIVRRELWDWYYKLVLGEVEFRTVTVAIHEPSGKGPVVEWEFRDAFPFKWQGPDLNATQNNVAVETFEICYHVLERRDP
jgi:phage tail-like protein